MRRIVTTFIAVAIVLGLLFLAAMRWLEPVMIYHPIRGIYQTPADAGMPYRDVTIATADGESLRGWWIPAPGSTGPALLFFHGNAGNREGRLHNLAGLHGAGIPVLIFDYRGYGGSSGRPSEQGLLRDGEAAFDWLQAEAGDRPVVFFGRSLGGAVAANVALRRPAAGLILESTFTNVQEMAGRVLPLPGIRYLTRSRFDALAAVRALELPLMVVHGTADELVPYPMGEALFKASASRERSFHAVPGGSHNDTYVVAGEVYYTWITSFLARLAP